MNPKRPVLPLTGGCSCGAIRYEIASFPLLLYSCNCTDCQAASGSAFALNMPVATADFHMGWRRASPSGADVTSWFCGECGARIYGERQGRPQTMNLRAGTLDDTGWLVPVADLFTSRAQGWIRPAAGAECHALQAPDFGLALKWRAMWPEFFPEK